MLREFTARPNPCSRRWVTFRLSVEAVDGFRSFRNPVVVSLELLKPMETVVRRRKLGAGVAWAGLLELPRVLVRVTKVLVGVWVASPTGTTGVMTGPRWGRGERVGETPVRLWELPPPAWLAAL